MAKAFPDLSEVVLRLENLAEVEGLSTETPIMDLDVESLDLLELIYELADEYELEIDETVFEGVANMTLLDLYERVRERSVTGV